MLPVGAGDAAGHQSGVRRDGRGVGLDGHRHESASPQKTARDEAVRGISRLDHESDGAGQVLRRGERRFFNLDVLEEAPAQRIADRT